MDNDAIYDRFVNYIIMILDKAASNKIYKYNNKIKRNRWYDNQIKEEVFNKDRAYHALLLFQFIR